MAKRKQAQKQEEVLLVRILLEKTRCGKIEWKKFGNNSFLAGVGKSAFNLSKERGDELFSAEDMGFCGVHHYKLEIFDDKNNSYVLIEPRYSLKKLWEFLLPKQEEDYKNSQSIKKALASLNAV